VWALRGAIFPPTRTFKRRPSSPWSDFPAHQHNQTHTARPHFFERASCSCSCLGVEVTVMSLLLPRANRSSDSVSLSMNSIRPLTHNWIGFCSAGLGFSHYKIAPLRWNWIVIYLAGFSFRHCKCHHFLWSPGIKSTLRGIFSVKIPKIQLQKSALDFGPYWILVF
jgi:hypothetical protein